MTTSTGATVRLTDCSALIAAVPHLLGFHPHDSLVLITHRGRRRTTLGMTLRVDLPRKRDYQAFVGLVTEPVLRNTATGCTVVIVGGAQHDIAGWPDALPHRELVELLGTGFSDRGVPLLHALWTPLIARGQPWCCYDEDDTCSGTVADPSASTMAAASTVAGAVTYPSRDDLAATLRPDDRDALRRRAAMLVEATERTRRTGPVSPVALLRVVTAAIDAKRTDDGPLCDATVVELLVALSDRRVRDACLQQADLAHAAAAERLWVALTRAAPVPARAEPACLLALSAYLRGDGALAAVALDRAEAAQPRHTLTGLLRQAQQAGLTPQRLAEVLSAAVERARDMLTQQADGDA